MGAKKPGELSQMFAKAVTAGDIDAVVALYEKGAASPDQAGTVHNGVDEIRTAFIPFAQMKPDIKCDPRKVVEAGEREFQEFHAVALMRSSGVRSGWSSW